MKPISILGHPRPISKIRFNSVGNLFFSSCAQGRLCAWDPKEAKLLKRYTFSINDAPVEKAIWGFDITNDSQKLIVASAAGIFIVDVCSGKQLHYFGLNDCSCRYVEWNKKPDDQSRFVAVRQGFDPVPKAILIFELKIIEEREIWTIAVTILDFSEACLGASWGPYDETILSWHQDGSLILWDSETGTKLAEAKHFNGSITCVDFNDNRTLCLCTSTDRTAKLIYIPTLERIQSYITDRPLNTGSISPLISEQDENRRRMHIIVAGGQSVEEVTITKTQEGKLETILMNIVTAELLGCISGHFSPITCVTFMPDGTGFATGAVEGFIRIYTFDQSYFTDPVYG